MPPARRCVFLTHPNVVISCDVPVPRWPLSARGLERMRAGLAQPWLRGVSALYCSEEQKALDSAAVLAGALTLPVNVVAALGENDRSSTGFLEPDEFERTADRFFAAPDESVRGWETARAAQRRIVEAVATLVAADRTRGTILVVSHGAVGALLQCSLAARPISRAWDQPANGGGNYFTFTLSPPQVDQGWRPFDEIPAGGGRG